ncbi:unnamed protein product [Dimorphilus gyrociliatus]|uniref:TOG domain-containing protein n=1 Tax=Dimorphilus gyrociliatus TaxID=2664684 RepID=A0A7I8VYH7_9ANNE|nr:unnamed protein product [Dimorphilus gyrociliatus]
MAVQAKLAPFPARHQSHRIYPHCRSSLAVSMEEDDLAKLQSDTYSYKLEILDRLYTQALTNGGHLPFRNCTNAAVYSSLSSALCDPQSDVRQKCIELIDHTLAQQENVDSCMSVLMQKLIPNIGDSNIAIRKAVTQTLKHYMSLTSDLQELISAIVNYGLSNPDTHIRRETIIALPIILHDDQFAHENFFKLAQSLCQCLRERDAAMKRVVLTALGHIRKLVGDSQFSAYIKQMPHTQQSFYYEAEGGTGDQAWINSQYSNFSADEDDGEEEEEEKLEFGVIPQYIMTKVYNTKSTSIRQTGMEQLFATVSKLDDIGVHCLQPHLMGFISFLHNMLDDPHFKLTMLILDTIGSLVNVLGPKAQHYTRSFVLAFTKRMPDALMKISIMKGFITLMHALTPKIVVPFLADNLRHKNHKIRQETLNVIIATVLRFPSNDLNLGGICQLIAHTLVDPKKQVRLASLECFSSIAQSMGAGRREPLANAVDSVELSSNGEGALAAVQARLARRLLPKINTNGLVEYATPLSNRNSFQGVDIDWIEQASSSTNSARSMRSIPTDVEVESVTSFSARSTPTPGESTNTPRRIISAKSKSKLPWSASEDGDRLSFSSSWPDPRMFEEARSIASASSQTAQTPTPTPRRVLDPIPMSAAEQERETPIPTRAILARSNSTKNGRLPSAARRPPSGRSPNADAEKESVISGEDEDEMMRSLTGIRNSASMKKAEKHNRPAPIMTNHPSGNPPQGPSTPTFSPHGGVTFNMNSDFMASIKGTGIGLNNEITESTTSVTSRTPIARKPVHRARDSTAGISSSEQADSAALNNIALQGKGVFEPDKNELEEIVKPSKSTHPGRDRRRVTKQPKAQPPSPALRKKNSTVRQDSQDKAEGADCSSHEDDELSLKPFTSSSSPHQLVDMALGKLESSEWERKTEGIRDFRRIARFHTDCLKFKTHQISLGICAEAKNLRSQVARSAVFCLKDLFSNAPKCMDAEMDFCTKTLLLKYAESNQFIKNAVVEALDAIVDNTQNHLRCANALIGFGMQHKNPVIRGVTARSLLNLVRRAGVSKIFEKSELCERLLNATVHMLQDGASDTRTQAAQIVHFLADHDMFERMLNKYVPDDRLKAVRGRIDKYKARVPESMSEPASAASSAKRSRSVTSSNRSQGQQLTSDELKALTSQLAASDWRERQEGLEKVLNLARNRPASIGVHMTRVLDKLASCARDSNSKVTLYTLNTLPELVELLNEYMSMSPAGQLSQLVGAITLGMASKQRETRRAATNALDAVMNLDAAQLLQPFVNQAQGANSRLKPDLVDRVAYLVSEVYNKKPKAVTLHAVPLLWHTFGVMPSPLTSTSPIVQAGKKLAMVLYKFMGDGLYDAAPNRFTSTLADILYN